MFMVTMKADMWVKLLPFIKTFVFVCKACEFDISSTKLTYDDYFYYYQSGEYLYDIHVTNVLKVINCGEELDLFNTKVNGDHFHILICTNSSNERYDPGYYKDIVLDEYKINLNAKSLIIAFGSLSNTTFHKVKRVAVFGAETYFWSFNHCDLLQEISVKNSSFAEITRSPYGILRKYTSLIKLDIQDTPMSKEIIMHLLHGVFLKELTIRNCRLYELPESFNNLTGKLIKLDLSHNYLRFVPFTTKRTKSSVFKNLEIMDLSYNQLEDSASVLCTAALMPRLRDLILDYNFSLDICNSNYCNDQSTKPKDQLWMVFPELKNISASFTNTLRLCFGLMKAESLVVFNISYSKVSTLSELPAFTASNFTMDLRGNNITNIEFFDKNENDGMNSRFTKHNTKTTVLANVKQLQCDCQYSWLQKTFNDISNLGLQDISCSDGIQLIHKDWHHLNCTKFDCGDCVCRRDSKFTTANCSSGSTRTIPMVENLSHVYAVSNRIESLNASLFSDKLILADFRKNQISRLDLETLGVMFSKEDRHFRLAGNPIICDCANQVLLKTFRLHRDQVDDYNDLTCFGGETLLNSFKEDQLCDSKRSLSGTLVFTIPLACICVVLIILALMNFVYYSYRHQIKIFLYARGWFLCCIRENDNDENRPYDVFISFAHEDEQFVSDELLPGLETGATVYKTCIHLRDWIPGEMITSQVINSIERSQRTLIVVSKSYVKSIWGLMEFHMAHASAMAERRIRLIVILLENMSQDDLLDRELRLYLQTNTYLQWGDPWFWDKLRYALPHKHE